MWWWWWWLLVGAVRAVPECAYVADGGGLHGWDDPDICTELKVDSGFRETTKLSILKTGTGVAGVRCCDGGTGEYSGASLCLDGEMVYCRVASFETAAAECADAGMRLCSVEEVLAGVGNRTSCAYPYMHVWTQDAAECPEASATTCVAIADGAGVRFPDNPKRCPNKEYDEDPDSFAAYADSQVAGVRCCGPSVISVCDANCEMTTFAEAKALCEQAVDPETGRAHRLCTQREVRAGIARNTGCYYDFANVWTSDVVPCPLAVERFDLVVERDDAATITTKVLEAGENLVRSHFPSVRAVVAGYVGSVVMQIADDEGRVLHERADNHAPFELSSRETTAGSFLMEFGKTYTLTATPFVGPNAEEFTGAEALSITFSLVVEEEECGPPRRLAANTGGAYLVETIHGQIIAKLEEGVLNRFFLHLDNDPSRNILDAAGNEIPDVDSLTLVFVARDDDACFQDDAYLAAAKFELWNTLDNYLVHEDVVELTNATTRKEGGLFGRTCQRWNSGLATGAYVVTVTTATQVVELRFRIDKFENGNLVAAANRPKLEEDASRRTDVLDVVPFAMTPRYGNWSDRPYRNMDWKDELEQKNRINFVTSHNGFVYVCMELTAVVYRLPGDASTTFEERNSRLELWFDLTKAVEAATQGSRTVNVLTRQHSGLRTIAFHPNFEKNGLLYASYMETWDDEWPSYRYLSIYDNLGPGDVRAPADAVVAEFKVVDDKVDPMSYRPLFRIAYNETGADYALYEHPIKQCTFGGGIEDEDWEEGKETPPPPPPPPPYILYCGSGDGSVDSSIAFGGQDKNIYGKIIAIDVGNGEYANPYEYGIPDINVWGSGTDSSACCASAHRAETYAIGFRNPHSIAFIKRGDRAGAAIVSDAGRDNGEEINVVTGPGGNFGWMQREAIYVHLNRPGIGDGVDPILPEDDEKFGYTYPATFLGHDGLPGASFTAQAIIGSHAVENSSPLGGRYFFSNFPKTAPVFYSMLDDLLEAKTTGPNLTQAPIYKTKLRYFESDAAYAANTPKGVYENFHDIIQLIDQPNVGPNVRGRTDLRFGEGPSGELYIVSKRIGHVFIVKNSLPGVETKKPFVVVS